MITNALIAVIWILNTVAGNNGSMLHMIFYRTFQVSGVFALLNLVLVYLAFSSYGTMPEVWKSWTGYVIGTSVYKAPVSPAKDGEWNPALVAPNNITPINF